MRDVPHPPKGYPPHSTHRFSDLKKRILINAHAFFAYLFPKAKRFDLITSSTTPTGRLDSVEYRGALTVYPDPKSSNWKMLYKSNPCPTAEDAAFEVKYWLEEDMSAMFDKMKASDTWVAAATAAARAAKGKPPSEAQGKKGKARRRRGKPENVQATKNPSKSRNTTVDDGENTGNVSKGNDIPKQPNTSTLTDRTKAGADVVVPDLKRNSAAKDETDRMKSMKIDDEERVFVGDEKEKQDTQQEKKTVTEPTVFVPIKE